MRKMRQNKSKKIVSFLMALIMTFSLVPVQAFATETGEEPHNHTEVSECVHEYAAGEVVAPTPEARGYTPYTCQLCGDSYQSDFVDYVAPEGESAAVVEWTDEMLEIQEEIDHILDFYLSDYGFVMPEGTPSETELAALYAQMEDIFANQMDDNVRENALSGAKEIEAVLMGYLDAGMITEAEAQTIVDANPLAVKYAELAYEYGVTIDLLATVNPIDGVEISDDKNKLTLSNGVVTAQASPGRWWSSTTNTLTLKNTSSSTATITFNYSAGNCDGYSVPGASYNDYVASSSPHTGSCSVILAAGATTTLTLKSRRSDGDASLVLSNFAITAAAASSQVTVAYDGSLGSVTAGGAAVAANGVVEISSSGAELVATPDGSDFLGWTDGDGKILSTSTSYTLIPASDMTVKAAFANATGAAWFRVGKNQAGSYLFNDLTAAATYASSASSKTVILAADGTLPAGDYTIPSGNTLLIPKDDSNSVQTTQPARIEADTNHTGYKKPTAHLTLHMEKGANITVSGAISIAGSQYAGGSNHIMGGVCGPVGFIRMDEGSKITVNNGAKLYTWGYVTGSGEVEVLRGGTVYESFQTTDWRGGSASSAIVNNNSHKVFPMNQYYVQNIEVPMKLNAGAVEKGYSCTTISYVGVQGAEVPFVGDGSVDSLFTIDSGYLLKDYDESEDRQIYEIHGDVSMYKIRISMKLSIVGSVTLDSSEYVLPITNNLTVDVVSGTINITQNLAFLPGAEIIVKAGATCNLDDSKSIYVYDLDDWGGYCGSGNKNFIPVFHAPGRIGTRTELSDAKVQIDGTINAGSGFLYTTTGGAEVFSTGTGVVKMQSGTTKETYQFTQNNTNCNPVAIPVQVAKLQNGDHTAENPSTTDPTKINPSLGVVYTYTDGVWVADCPGDDTCVVPNGPACKDKVCNHCDYTISATQEHTPDEENPATCTTDQVCSVCGDVVKEKLNHKNGGNPVDAVTPQWCYSPAAGHKAYYTCKDCGKPFVDSTCQTPIADLDAWKAEGGDGYIAIPEHTWGAPKRTAEPTCTEAGSETYECTACRDAANADTIDDAAVATKIEPVAAAGHSEKMGSDCKDATCIATGIKDYWYCERCGIYYSDEACTQVIGNDITTWKAQGGNGFIEKKPHNTDNGNTRPQVDATCTQTGTKAYWYCSACETYYSDKACNDEIDDLTTWKNGAGQIQMAAHTEVLVTKVPATCLAAGAEAGTKCDVCDEVLSGCTEIPQLPHKGHVIAAEAPTCIAPGHLAYYQCDNGCTNYFSVRDNDGVLSNEIVPYEWMGADGAGNIPALGHHLVPVPEVPADCKNGVAGTAAHYECKTAVGCDCGECGGRTVFCGKLFDKENQEPVDAETLVIFAAHTPAVREENRNEETGVYERVTYCEVCNTEIDRITVTPGAEVAHTGLVQLPHVEATCHSEGKTAGAYCSVGYERGCPACVDAGETYNDPQEVIPMQPHTVIPGEVEGTWNEDNTRYTVTATCAVEECGAEVTETVDVDAEKTVVKNATCESDGSVTYTSGAFTDEAFTNAGVPFGTKTVKIDKLDHSYGAVEYEWSADHRTCTATQVCSNATMDSCTRTETVESTNVVTDPTCTEAGYTTYKADFTQTWAVDQTEKVAGEEATGHVYTVDQSTLQWTLNGDATTCTANLVCDEADSTLWTVSAVVTKTGSSPETCEGTGEINYSAEFVLPESAQGTLKGTVDFTAKETIPAKNHDWEYSYAWAEDYSTCTATRTCRNDAQHTETETVEATFQGGASCTQAGTRVWTADFDDALFATQTKDQYSDALGHDSVKHGATESTCAEKGYKGNDEYYTCSRCSGVFKDEACTVVTTIEAQTLPFNQHKYTTYIYDGNATCVKNGTKTAQCDYGCGVGTKTVDDPEHPATTHNYVGEITENPTCTTAGTETFTCQNQWCTEEDGKTYTEPVDALGHELVKFDGEESTCDEAGHVAYYRCAAISRTGERSYYCGYYFANETDTAVEATPIATTEQQLTTWKTTPADENGVGGGALVLRQCVDADKNHECDYEDCDKDVGVHKDDDKNHQCDYYGSECTVGTFGTHEENTRDTGHKCDYCGVKMGDHVFTNGSCTCGYVQDLKVTITIKAQGTTDQTLPEETIKFSNEGRDYTAVLNLSSYGDCYIIESVTAKVGGVEVESTKTENTLTIASALLTDDVEIVVNARQTHVHARTETERTEATCLTPGKEIIKLYCAKCGKVYSEEEKVLNALDHDWEETEVAPTFDADGYTLRHCKRDSSHDVKVVREGTKLIAVARIGTTRYQSLEEAIEAAVNRDTIELLTKGVVEGTQVWDKNITVLIPAVDNGYGLIIKGDLTIKNGTFVVNGFYGIAVQPTAKLTIEEGSFELERGVDNDYLIGTWGTTVINGGEFVGQYCCVNAFDSYDPNVTSTLTITGGTFETEEYDSTGEYESSDVFAEGENTESAITGGTFSKSVEDYVAEGHCQVKEGRYEYNVAPHDPGDAEEENRIEADCVNPGSYQLVKDCTRCGEEISREDKVIEATGHTVAVVLGREADCLNDGYREAYHCTVCNKYYATRISEKELADEITVDLSVWQTTEGEKAAGGKIAALPHNTYTISATPVTCEKAGNNQYYKCFDCKNFFEDEAGLTHTTEEAQIIPATGHEYDEGVILEGDEPTCEEKGTKTFTCQNDWCQEDHPNHTYTTGVEKLGHEWDEGVYLNEADKPTCTEPGTLTYTCVRNCTKTERVDATGHKGQFVPSQSATCTSDGWKAHYRCQNACGLYYVDASCTTVIGDADALESWKTTDGKLPASGHNYVSVEGKTPDCDDAGYKASFKCNKSYCGLYFIENEEGEKVLIGETGSLAEYTTWISEGGAGYLEPNGHTDGPVEIENVVAAQCEVDGSHDEVTKCTVCGEETSREHKVDLKTGHTGERVVDATAPSCTATGLTEGKYCDACKKWTVPQTVVAATGHTPVVDSAVEASCTATGLTEGSHCDVCGTELVKQVVVPKKNHNHAVILETNLATCTEDGSQKLKCETCDDTITKTLTAPGHNKNVTLDAEDPTCTETGLTEGKKCSVCGTVTVPQDIIPAKGHNQVTAFAQVDTSCEADGVKAYYFCDDCDTYYATRSTEDETVLSDKIGNAAALELWKNTLGQGKIEKLPHTEETIPAVAPTCTEDGWKAGVKCSVCGDTLVEQERDPAKGHNYVNVGGKTPDCDDAGYKASFKCNGTDCGLYFTEKAADKLIGEKADYDAWISEGGAGYLQPNGHTVEETVKVDPKCNAFGTKAYYFCDDCDLYYATRTGEKELADEIGDAAALELWKNTLGQGKIAMLPHTEVVDPYQGPSCTEKGKTEGKHCEVCGHVIKAQDDIPMKPHTETIDAAKAPTCTETGLTEGKHCSVCNAELVKQEEVPAKGHSGELVKGQPAKCEADGWKDYYQCKECKLYFLDENCQEPIADLAAWKTGDGKLAQIGHKWDDGRETTLPTCTEPGVMTFTCYNCNGPRTEEIPELGHDPEPHAAQHPTYYSAGWNEYETCSRCDYNTLVPIEALGEPSVHTFGEFMTSLKYLEEYANAYAKANPGKDPMWLLIKYVRTGVDRYNSGSWNIMAGYEDEGFAKYVMDQEESYNKAVPTIDDMINVTGIKNIANFDLPNGDSVDFGHMFGTMDITYHNKTSINHADVAGWAGDLVDLLSTADRHGVTGKVDEMIKVIGEQYLNHSIPGESDQFSQTDMYGDLDGYYFMNELIGADYEAGMLYNMMKSYFSDSLTTEQRADYFLKNRLGGVTGRNEIREAVFSEYLGNSVIATLEGTREFQQADVSDMRKACCYAFADYLCKLAGDYVELGENPYFSVFSSELSTLAPGITQQISKATTADGKQVVYYTATADVNSPYVDVYANYKDNDPTLGWGMQRVRDQANAAQAKYGDPASDKYIPNYNVIAAINGAGYNMTTGEPSGVLVMNGVEYHKPNGDGFVGILTDGSAYIGTDAEYYEMMEKGLIAEAISGFGTVLVKDGKINVTATSSYFTERASRTAFGITKTGKVVFMVMDGRQEPVSCGGSMVEIAQVMLEAGCVQAINLDGGGSTTYVARVPGDDALSVVSSPSDGFERSVSTSLFMVSTAPSSTEFDKAILNSDVRHVTIGATAQLTASAVSAMGNAVDMPEGTTWAVSDSSIATISEDGVLTGVANGTVNVNLMLGDKIVGSRTMYVVIPDTVYFTKENMNAVYGEPATLPVAALFEGKPVAITENDATFSLSNAAAGTTEGYTFIGDEASNVKAVRIYAHAVFNPEATSGSMNINLFKPGETSFDFDNAVGGDRLLAWERVVSNSTTVDEITYNVVDKEEPMVTEYAFGMDMTQIPMPEELVDLVYMLPGADVEGNNSAWDFLLQLAERVSVLTEVKATIQMDPRFDVDYSEMSVVCEYFNLEKTELDPETNELVLSLRWKDQTKAIDPDTANPIVILSGITLTPKADADWGAREQLAVVNSGNISYDIYLRANALYSFASKEENQQAFKLYPFVNPDVIIGGAPESGGHFMDTYKEFKDEYTLIRGLKNGWVYEDGGYAYYVDDVKYTGIRKVGQYYYDFGENGINIGQTKYSGMFQIDDVNYYSKEGLLSGGWHIDKDNKYYFDETGKAVDGEVILDEVKMVFNNGLLIGGQTGFVEKTNGNTYYYQNGNMYFGWLELGNDWYHFNTENGIMTVGDGTANSKLFPDQEAKAKGAYYVFDAEGRALYGFPNNFGYYYWAGQPMRDQWVRNGYDLDAWYHTNGNGHYVTTPNASETEQLELDGVTYTAVVIAYDGVEYTFDNTNGKLLLGSKVLKAGQWYYYWAGEPVNDGWFDFAGDTYYAYADGHLATGSHVIDGETYMFTPQGALIKEGPALKVTMNSDFTQMTVVTSQFKDVAAVKMAVWSEAGNQQDMKWFDASVDGDGVWSVTIPMCQNYKHTGEYLIHAYEFNADGVPVKVLVNTTFKVDKIGHVANEPVKQNVDAKTCVKDGSYDLVTTCKLCNETIDSVHKTEPATGHTDADTNDMCDVCGEYLGETIETIAMHRLYNPNTGEHFYTGSEEERDTLVEAGWQYEGVAWNAPATAGAPIFRLYNPNSGDHHYTGSEEERDMLVDLGWQYEGVAWNTLAQTEHPQYRLYNPNADIGSHHYTGSAEERDFLVSLGWHYEGIGWYGC